MTQLAEVKTRNDQRLITIMQIDAYDAAMRDETGTLNEINTRSTKGTDNSRAAEAHAIEIRRALMVLREQIVLYEFYTSRL